MSQKTCHKQSNTKPGGRFSKDAFIMFLSSFLFLAGLLVAETPDTLQPVTIVADRGVVVSRTDMVSVKGTENVADAIKRVPGLSLSDYGGAAGLKGVSLRGLGTAGTSIYFDGVRVGKVQSGQADLGLLDMENIGSIVVDYAQNSVSFNTPKPDFMHGPFGGRLSFKGGSFGTYMPSGRFDFKATDNVSISASTSVLLTDGNYEYGSGLRRTNNDLKQVNAGIDIFGKMEGGGWHTKMYVNGSRRGAPGSTSWPSEDRQNDKNAFAQGTLSKKFSDIYTLNVSSKAAYDNLFYKSVWGDSEYTQKEYQLNSSHNFRIREWWDLSFAADGRWDELGSTGYRATRYGAVSTLTSVFRLDRLKADISVEYEGTFDKGASSHSSLSPAADIRYTLSEGLEISAFGRRAYRTPTFNELYYPNYGNPDLKPEDAWLTDIGLEWHKKSGRWQTNAKLDGFYNYLTDKITSAPSAANPYLWLPYNIGTVKAAGIDATAGIAYSSDGLEVRMSARYSYQSAKDKTPGSATYGQQIAYVAGHTAVMTADASYLGYDLGACWNLRSGRYAASGSLPAWNTLDISIHKTFTVGHLYEMVLSLTGKNLLDMRYEIVRGYPVPGRSLTGGIEFRF